MRIYPRKLRNIEDLEREKSRLLKASRQLDEEGFLPSGIFSGKKNSGGKNKEENKQGSWLDFLPGSNPVAEQLINIVQNTFFKKSSKSESGNNFGYQLKNQGKSLLKAFAKEFIGGYLKWKAIEWTFKGLRYMIKSKAGSKKSKD